jgi:hypothetical protein
MRGPQRLRPPDTIVTRLDGWIGSPGHIPMAVAEAIVRAMPNLGDSDTVTGIKGRMIARQRMFDRMRRAVSHE